MKEMNKEDIIVESIINYELKRKNRELREYVAHMAGFKSMDDMTEYIRIHGEL